jgi:hypothetical protein
MGGIPSLVRLQVQPSDRCRTTEHFVAKNRASPKIYTLMSSQRFATRILTVNSTSRLARASWFFILFLLVGLIQHGLCSQSRAQLTPRPKYDWDFSPSMVKVKGTQAFDAFVTIRNLPNSPVNLLGSQWYALDLFPGLAAEFPDGPYRINFYDLAVSSMDLSPGESFTTRFARFTPRYTLNPSYDELLIAGAYMRFLGPSNEFLDVGGLNKQLRVTIIPEPATAALLAFGMLAILSSRRFRR